MTDPIIRNEADARITYYNLLRELTFNSKEKINQLSQISEKNSKYAHIIVEVVYKHIKEAIPGQKLPTLYLIDSIIKNVGGIYKRLFEEHIVEMFLLVFESGTGDIKTSLYKLRNTWRKEINEKELAKLDRLVKERDSNWPIQSVQGHCVYANPSFSNGTNLPIHKQENIIIPPAPAPLQDMGILGEPQEPPQRMLANFNPNISEPDKKKEILQALRDYKKTTIDAQIQEKQDNNTVPEVHKVEDMDTSRPVNHKTASPRPHEDADMTSPNLQNDAKRLKYLDGIDDSFFLNIIKTAQSPAPEQPPPNLSSIPDISSIRTPLQIPPPTYPQMQPNFRGPMPEPVRHVGPVRPLRGPHPPRGPPPPRGHPGQRLPHPRGGMGYRGHQQMKGPAQPLRPQEPRHPQRRTKRSPRGRDTMHIPPFQQRQMHSRPPMMEPMPHRPMGPPIDHRPAEPRMPPPLSLHPTQFPPEQDVEISTIEGQPYKVIEPEIPKLEMKMECLVERINVVVQHVHKGDQCGTCGIRFDKNSALYRTHLDWHYQVNRHKPKSTFWYFPEADWIKYVPDQKEQLSEFFEQEREKWVRDKKEEEEKIANVVLRDSELVQRCRICRDLLEMYFDQDNDEWCCKDAVRLGNKMVVHKECAKDYTGPLSDTTPTPVTERPLGKEGLISPDFLMKGGETSTREITDFSLTSEHFNLLKNILGTANQPKENIKLELEPGSNYPVINPDKIELEDTDSEDTVKMSHEPVDDNREAEPIEDGNEKSVEMKSPSVDSDKSMELSLCEEPLFEESKENINNDSELSTNSNVSVIQVFPNLQQRPTSESGESDIQTDPILRATESPSRVFT